MDSSAREDYGLNWADALFPFRIRSHIFSALLYAAPVLRRAPCPNYSFDDTMIFDQNACMIIAPIPFLFPLLFPLHPSPTSFADTLCIASHYIRLHNIR